MPQQSKRKIPVLGWIFVTFYVLGIYSGAYSLSRLWPDLSALGILLEIRWIPMFVLLPIAIYSFASRKHNLKDLRRVSLWAACVLLLHLLVICSIAWSRDPTRGLAQSLDILLLIAYLSVLVLAAEMMTRDTLDLWLKLALALGLGTTIATLLLIIASGQIFTYATETPGAFVLGFGGIGIARLQGTAILICLFFSRERRNSIWLIPVPIILLGITLSGSRAAVLALGISALIFVAFTASFRTASKTLVVSIILFVASTFAAISLGVDRLFALYVASFQQNEQLYLAGRDLIYLDAIAQFMENPVLGTGLGTYVGRVGFEEYPHNLILNILVDTGTVGGFVFLLSLTFTSLTTTVRGSPTSALLFSLAIFYFISSLFTGTYYDARLFWIYTLLLVIFQRKSFLATAGEGAIR